MCKKVNYSKYQKRVIKFLTELLGTGTPFSYEKTQTNHLKVLIDGVPKPLYTSSTPSDSKSLNNFMAEVKREIKATQSEMTFKPASAPKKVAIHREVSFERLILTCIKSIRTRLDVLKTQEESQVLEAKQVEIVAPFRTDIIKQVIKVARQAQKQISYIKPGDMSFIEETVKKHFDFMMPTLGQYAKLLNNKDKYVVGELDVQHSGTVAINDTLVDTPEQMTVLETATKEKSASEVMEIDDQSSQDSVTQLMVMSANNRISLLRNLTNVQALSLIDEINQAMAINREQDIASVVAMIRAKDLPLEAIISRLEAV